MLPTNIRCIMKLKHCVIFISITITHATAIGQQEVSTRVAQLFHSVRAYMEEHPPLEMTTTQTCKQQKLINTLCNDVVLVAQSAPEKYKKRREAGEDVSKVHETWQTEFDQSEIDLLKKFPSILTQEDLSDTAYALLTTLQDLYKGQYPNLHALQLTLNAMPYNKEQTSHRQL
jgi:hypothetical protein